MSRMKFITDEPTYRLGNTLRLGDMNCPSWSEMSSLQMPDFSCNIKNNPLRYQLLRGAKGQEVAFVGATKAGKTTITNRVNRFYDIQSGSITYDGIDVKRLRKIQLHRSLGIVLQDTHLFTGTIAKISPMVDQMLPGEILEAHCQFPSSNVS